MTTRPNDVAIRALTTEPLDDDQRATVEANMPLVWHVVLRMLRLEGDAADEAAAAGMLGLIRAVQKYDPALSAFSTYATVWIRQAIGRNHETLSGASYRRAKRLGEPWQDPLSIDQIYGDPDDGTTLADTLVAGDHTAHLGHLPPAILDACTDELDRRIVAALADGRRVADVARDTGHSRQMIHQRLRRLRQRLQPHADETAA